MHRMKHYPLNSVLCFFIIYPPFEQLGTVVLLSGGKTTRVTSQRNRKNQFLDYDEITRDQFLV